MNEKLNHLKKISIIISIIGVSILSFFSYNHICQKQVETKIIENTNWTALRINENLIPLEEKINDWVYPWYVIKHDDGHFENILGEGITEIDTTKIYCQSYCYSLVEEDTISRLKFAEAQQVGQTVFIKLFDESASNNETLELEVIDFEKFNPTYKLNLVFPHDSVVINFLRKEFEIKKKNYQIGDDLVGKVDMEFEQKIYRKGKKQTNAIVKKISGIFKVKIE